MIQVITIAILLYLGYDAIRGIINYVRHKLRKRTTALFDNNYIEVKQFYVHQFGNIPCISFISNIDCEKVFDYINAGHAGKVLNIHQRNFYSWQRTRREFSITIFTLEKRTMIEVGSD